MQTIDRINTRLDEVQEKAPRPVAAWMKLNRAIAGRASTFVTGALSTVTGSARRVGETATKSAKTVGNTVETSATKVAKTVETSATKVAKTAEKEIVDVAEDATARLEASADAADKVRLSQMTKETLYERAQMLGIDGRSQMTKDQLVDEIMTAEGSTELV